MSLALSTFAILERSVLTDEGGGTDRVTSLGVGAYLWMASMFVFGVYVLLHARQLSQAHSSSPETNAARRAGQPQRSAIDEA